MFLDGSEKPARANHSGLPLDGRLTGGIGGTMPEMAFRLRSEACVRLASANRDDEPGHLSSRATFPQMRECQPIIHRATKPIAIDRPNSTSK